MQLLDPLIPCAAQEIQSANDQIYILLEKHPPGKSAYPAVLLDPTNAPKFNLINIECQFGNL